MISVIAMATDYTQSDEASINLNVITKEVAVKIVLTTPRVSGSSKIQYGDDYTVSWDFDEQVDYYQITIAGLNYKKTVNATEKSFTIPGSVFKQYSGADTNYTISLVAMSHDTEKYLPSEAATIRVKVAGYSESNVLIKSAEILDGNEIIAGTVVRFKIVTTRDVTALRMKDGAGSFIVNTWYAADIGTNSSNAQHYIDSGNERTWYIQQKVNHAGDENAAGAKRLLTFYSMVNEVEYNSCSVSFYCKKGNDVIGKFEITSPSNNAMLPSGKDIVINWSAPTNTNVDYYIVDIYHGDVRVIRTTVAETMYTLSGALLEKDSIAWQIRVTARKDEGQWAESVATASFKLECTHEHLGQPTENILSYAQKNDTVHSCVVEKTYACLDCGLANAKKVQETVTKSHNWIALDKGGKVCNECWHLQSDGSFTVKKDMQLSSLAGNREFVYWGVDASGSPANKQNGRYVDKSDKITILGEVGNCYLIEYPITVNTRASGATNCGFIDSDLVSAGSNSSHKPDKTDNQKKVEAYIATLEEQGLLLDLNKQQFVYEYKYVYTAYQYYCKNYGIDDQIAHTLLSGDLLKRTFVWLVGSGQNGEDNYLYEQKYIVQPILEAIFKSMPELTGKSSVTVQFPNLEEDVKNADQLIEFFDKAKGTIENFEDFADADIADSVEYIRRALSGSKDAQNIVDALDQMEEAIKKGDKAFGKYEKTLILWKLIVSYVNYVIVSSAVQAEYFDVLLEDIPVIEETELLRDTIQEMKEAYLGSELKAVATIVLQVASDEILEETSEMSLLLSVGFFVGKSLALKTVAVALAADFAITYITKATGVADAMDAKDYLTYYGYMPYILKESLLARLVVYDGTQEMADAIVNSYDLWRASQIFFNNQLVAAGVIVDFEGPVSSSKKEITQINDHIKSATMDAWSFNPYEWKDISLKSDLHFSSMNYYYNILLWGDAYRPKDDDGVVEMWETKTSFEKNMINSRIEELQNFAKTEVQSLYILRMNMDIPVDFEYMYLFVNESNQGLLFYQRNKGDEAYMGYTIISETNVEKLLTEKQSIPLSFFAIQSYDGNFVFYSEYRKDGKGNLYTYTICDWLKIDISQEQYEEALKIFTSHKYCRWQNSVIIGGISFIDVLDYSDVIACVFSNVNTFWWNDKPLEEAYLMLKEKGKPVSYKRNMYGWPYENN